jgi:cysteine desulfurase
MVVGLGEAAKHAGAEHVARRSAAAKVKEEFLAGLSAVEHVHNGDTARTQAHVANLRFPGVDSEALMLSLRETVAISNGAACTSASYSPSHVLKAMGLSDDEISWSVRISWGPGIESIPSADFTAVVESLRVG